MVSQEGSSVRGRLKRGNSEEGEEVENRRPDPQRNDGTGTSGRGREEEEVSWGCKRQRTTEAQLRQATVENDDTLPELIIHVKWTSVSGRARVNELPLVPLPSMDDLRGVHKRLVSRAFGDSPRPAEVTSPLYLRFSTDQACLTFPMDVAATNFKLIASHDGWQYTLHETGVSEPHIGNEAKIHVTVIEYETIARIIGHLGIRLSMVAYPVVSVHKGFLEESIRRMRTDPSFKGILH